MKKLLRLFVFAAVIALFYGAYALFGARVANVYNARAAELARAAGDLDRAAVLYARVLDNSPRDESLRLLVFDLWRGAGNLSRAEHVLYAGLRDVGPSAALYQNLCAIYVEQDKLLDAVDLLNGIRSPDARERIEAARPASPDFLLPGGIYEERVDAGLAAGEDCIIYVSWTGGIPSISSDLYTGPVALGPGVTAARAVAVNADGLVSDWVETEYTLRNIIDPVTFSDPALERAIRTAVGKPDGLLFTSDLWEITELRMEEPAAYTTLDDLRYCPKLEVLSLHGSGAGCDISVLPELENLSRLMLASFALNTFDLEIIGQCGALEYLGLADNHIGSVTPLEGLERLIWLDLSSNNVLDVTPLSRLGSLQTLRLTQNALQELSALSALKNLRILEVGENRVTSLHGLAGLSSLEVLEVSNNPLTSVGELSSLPSLRILTAAYCQIETLPNLSRLNNLESITIHNNAITSLGGLTGLPSLRELYCQYNAISSLEPLKDCAALETLNVSNNAIESVEPLGGLPALARLVVENNQIKTLLPLKACPKLRDIYAFGNSLTDPLNAFNGTPLEGRVRR
jgi:Leucine-rich repeat (LRR) protein